MIHYEPPPGDAVPAPNLNNTAVIQYAIECFGHDGRKPGPRGVQDAGFWRPFLAKHAAAGTSPYGVNRHGRRMAESMMRRDASARRKRAREADAAFWEGFMAVAKPRPTT